MELKIDKIYLVKITDKDHKHFGRELKLKWAGIFMRSLISDNSILLWQCEVIKEIENNLNGEQNEKQ